MLTTHDLNGIAAHLPHLVCLNREVIGAGPAEEVLTAEMLERTYGAGMEVLDARGHAVIVDRPPASTARTAWSPPIRPPGGGGAVTVHELLRPYEFEFFRNGLTVATIAGALCGLVGRVRRAARA